MDWLLLLCAGLFGADDFETREFAQGLAEYLVVRYDRPGLLRQLAKDADDPEVRQRCRAVLDRYADVPVPRGMMLLHFGPVDPYRELAYLYRRADRHPAGVDAKVYTQLLIEEGGLTRSQVQCLVGRAQHRRATIQLEQSYQDTQRYIRRVLGIGNDHDCPKDHQP